MGRWPAALSLALVLLVPLAAEGQRRGAPVDREARNLFEAGQEAYATGSYERALEYFERAYALSPRARLLYNIATTADRMRADARALEAYRAFLAAEPETERRAEVEARIAFIEGLVRPPPEPEPSPAPTPEPVVEAPLEEVEAAPALPSHDAPRDAPAPSGGLHPAGVGTLVGAGLLFVSFGVFGGLSLAEDQSLATRCGRDVGATCAPAEVRDLEVFNAVADASWIAGSVATAVGLVLLLALPPEREAEPTSLSIAPWVGGDGAGVVGVGRW
jgi:tetratricopeptide (TPR) repeat protein